MIFFGTGVWDKLVFGPLSDSFGRKTNCYIGFIVFLVIASIIVFCSSLWSDEYFGRYFKDEKLSAPRT